jgi:hypothetical protein
MCCYPRRSFAVLRSFLLKLYVSSLPGCLIGRLLPRVLLSENGVSAENIQFAKTDAGKPYFARRLLFSLSVLTPAPASTVLPAGRSGRQSTHRV